MSSSVSFSNPNSLINPGNYPFVEENKEKEKPSLESLKKEIAKLSEKSLDNVEFYVGSFKKCMFTEEFLTANPNSLSEIEQQEVICNLYLIIKHYKKNHLDIAEFFVERSASLLKGISSCVSEMMKCFQLFTHDILAEPALLELVEITDRLIIAAKNLPENDKRNVIEWGDDNRESITPITK